MKTSTRILHWAPRIICILALLFMSLFALDSLHDITGLVMHLIPDFILLAILIVAWRWEKVGGIILTIAGLAWCIFVFQMNLRRTQSVWASLVIILMLCIPFVLAGILFIMSDINKKKA